MKQKYRLVGALCANALLVLFEVIALILSLIDQGLENFLFYTQDSNYLAMAASLQKCCLKKSKTNIFPVQFLVCKFLILILFAKCFFCE